jgi:predicted metal-binding protein
LFPTFNEDGTINVYQQQFRKDGSQTFITRMDPEKAPLIASNSQLSSQNCGECRDCNSPSNDQILKIKNALGSVHELSCTMNGADSYGHLRFDAMSRKECQSFFRTLLNNPKVVAAEKNVRAKPSTYLDRFSLAGLSLKEMYEFCPER